MFQTSANSQTKGIKIIDNNEKGWNIHSHIYLTSKDAHRRDGDSASKLFINGWTYELTDAPTEERTDWQDNLKRWLCTWYVIWSNCIFSQGEKIKEDETKRFFYGEKMTCKLVCIKDFCNIKVWVKINVFSFPPKVHIQRNLIIK